jgi:hypothetical protein
VQYPLDETRLAAAGRWLEAHGFAGNRRNGWTRAPEKGPRALVEVTHVDIRDVVMVFTSEGAP